MNTAYEIGNFGLYIRRESIIASKFYGEKVIYEKKFSIVYYFSFNELLKLLESIALTLLSCSNISSNL